MNNKHYHNCSYKYLCNIRAEDLVSLVNVEMVYNHI